MISEVNEDVVMTLFRPCIDLHNGQVKQIVGGTLQDEGPGPVENFVSERPPSWFAECYRDDGLQGGHIIQLGPGNSEAARDALRSWPGGMQLGGGVNLSNAAEWLEAGASPIIVTSWLFDRDGSFREDRLKELCAEVGREHVVVDLSCRRSDKGWTVAMNRWQTLTDIHITPTTLDALAEWCSEYLVHAADVEGLCSGIDTELVELLGSWGAIPVTYAGGVANMADLELVADRGGGKVDVTVGSALDIFGGTGVCYQDLVAWNKRGL